MPSPGARRLYEAAVKVQSAPAEACVWVEERRDQRLEQLAELDAMHHACQLLSKV